MDSQETQRQGRVIVVAGLNASGKTTLLEKLRREMKSDSVRYVTFCDTYGTSTDRSYYLQQRWNQHDIDEETPLAGAALERSFILSGPDTPQRRQHQQYLYELTGMSPLLDKYVITLSSGELRKMQLVKTLMARPSVLILDNPFIGLDIHARQMLSDQLLMLRNQGIVIYLAISRPGEIPSYADEIIWTTPQSSFIETAIPVTVPKPGDKPSSPNPVVEFRDVSIRYGQRTILNKLSWTVNEGEHWALSGRNGSGKSTLLSLICGDNPQAYACDISLFGRQRGSGESIWEIKRRIGYVSPELHRSYLRNLPVISIIASGLKDTVGLYSKYNEQEKNQCIQWMQRFDIKELAYRSFMEISSGEQRLALVCRAFVKNPDLLILDEPMHGLDLKRQQLTKDIIDEYCTQPCKTLIMVTHYKEELPTCIDHNINLE